MPARPCNRPQVWLHAVKYRLTRGDSDGARKALDRSLQALPTFEHIRMVSQAGLLEFKLGDPGEPCCVFWFVPVAAAGV